MFVSVHFPPSPIYFTLPPKGIHTAAKANHSQFIAWRVTQFIFPLLVIRRDSSVFEIVFFRLPRIGRKLFCAFRLLSHLPRTGNVSLMYIKQISLEILGSKVVPLVLPQNKHRNWIKLLDGEEDESEKILNLINCSRRMQFFFLLPQSRMKSMWQWARFPHPAVKEESVASQIISSLGN